MAACSPDVALLSDHGNIRTPWFDLLIKYVVVVVLATGLFEWSGYRMDVGSKHHQPSDHAAKTSPGAPALEFRMAETQSLALHMEH